ncbi:MAG: DUF4129 domain-containing protein [Acidimicrobiia bacterium]|nr:DUF4129 domain-containing protein [Acidimicrobiia bacterium]
MRTAVASLGAVAVIVAVAVLASGVGAGDDPAPGVGVRGSAALVDVVITALSVVGFVLLVVVVIGQLLGGGTGERRAPSRQKQLIGVVVVVAVAVVAANVLPDLWNVPDTTAEPPLPGAAPPPPLDRESSEPRETSGASVAAGVVLGLVIVALAAAVLWPRRGTNDAPDPPSGERSSADDRDLLGGLLDDAIAALRADPDPRRAVISAWARLEVALGAVGMPRHESEAPFPYLARILGALDASGPAVRRLAEVFERAKFSPHRIEGHHQTEAIDALDAVRDELRLGVSGT